MVIMILMERAVAVVLAEGPRRGDHMKKGI